MTPAEVPSGMEGTPQGQLKSFTLRRKTKTIGIHLLRAPQLKFKLKACAQNAGNRMSHDSLLQVATRCAPASDL